MLPAPSSRKWARDYGRITTFIQLWTTRSSYDLIDAGVVSLSADLAVNGKFREYFESAKKCEAVTNEEYDNTVQELNSEVDQKERE